MNAQPLHPRPLSALAAATAPRDDMAKRHDLDFLEFLKTFRRGEVLDEADQRLSELVEAIALHQGKGTLTLKLSFKVNKAGQIEVEPDVQIKKPVRAIGTGIYFATDDNRLTRRDPMQMDIEDEIDRRRSVED